MSDIAQRSAVAIGWSATTTIVSIGILFARSVLLARLLPVETFGIYAGAGAIISFSSLIADFGIGSAFVHRSKYTQDEEDAARIHFTLKTFLVLAWAIAAGIVSWWFAKGDTRIALLVLIATTAGSQLAQTPVLVLSRRVVHRRLSLMHIVTAASTTVAAVTFALLHANLWALLITDVVTTAILLLALYGRFPGWEPVWRPRFKWSWEASIYYLRFGGQVFVVSILEWLLQRADDLWLQAYSTPQALGYYARGYTFATYPRRIVAAPVTSVIGGTYAELKDNRLKLSKAFFRTNALLIRSGFLIAGIMALIAPEFIRIVLGSKWLPMLDVFRLMLIFTLLDPMQATISSLFVAMGSPNQLTWVRMVQLLFMLVLMAFLGTWYGIVGVAISVNIAVAVGVVLLLISAHQHVDFSPLRLFVMPVIGLVCGATLARAAITIPGVLGADWRTGVVKIAVFGLIYCAIVIGAEYKELPSIYRKIVRLWS